MSDLIGRLIEMGKGFKGYPSGCTETLLIREAAAEIKRLEAVVAAAKDWFLDDSELGETDATLIMVVGNYLAMVERDASCLDSGCEEGSHKPWCDHANTLEGEDE